MTSLWFLLVVTKTTLLKSMMTRHTMIRSHNHLLEIEPAWKERERDIVRERERYSEGEGDKEEGGEGDGGME